MQIAFAARGEGIHTIATTGGLVGPRRVTTGIDQFPSWSPDGQSIVYSSFGGGQSDLWIVSVAGGEPRRLTNDPEIDRNPSWSPDGELVAFDSYRGGDTNIWVVRVSNGALSQVTDVPGNDGDPSWCPAGNEIVFVSDRSGASELWIASDPTTVFVEPMSWTSAKRLFR